MRRSWRTEHYCIAGLAVAFAWLTWRQIASMQFLYADGSNEFFLVLQQRTSYIPLWTKAVADYLYRVPTLAAIHLFHVNQVSQLAKIHGATLFLHPYVSLLFCWFVIHTRKKNPQLMVFPLLSFLLANCSSSLFVVTQAHLAASLFWPLFLFLLLSDRLSAAAVRGVMVYTTLAAFTYQTSMVFCPLLSLVLVTRKERLTKMEWLFVIELLVLSAVIFYGVLTYPQIDNRHAFFGSARLAWLPQSVLTELLFASGICALISIFWTRARFVASLLSILLGGAYASRLLADPGEIDPFIHYLGRVLLLYVPVVTGAAAFIFNRRGSLRLYPSALTAILVLASVIWVAQWKTNEQWREYYTAYKQELKSHRGIVTYLQSSVGADGPNHLPGKFGWSWTNPIMSVIVSAVEWGVVETVIENKKDAGYNPYDPHTNLRDVDLRPYGVKLEY